MMSLKNQSIKANTVPMMLLLLLHHVWRHMVGGWIAIGVAMRRRTRVSTVATWWRGTARHHVLGVRRVAWNILDLEKKNEKSYITLKGGIFYEKLNYLKI